MAKVFLLTLGRRFYYSSEVTMRSGPHRLDGEGFLKLKGLKCLLTTGCNIPLFVAGQKPIKAVVTNQDGYNFEWHNFYDEDDVLGWPLKPLGKQYDGTAPGVSYAVSVTQDHEINANGGALGFLLKSWNPFSHGEYWEDSQFLRFLVRNL